jgi:hypothetical protein
MPTPRMHGGAPLVHIPLNVPAFKGLNRQAASSILGPEWATRLEETVFDENNRVSARKGWVVRTTTPVAGDFVRVFEFIARSGTRQLIGATNDGLYMSANNGLTWTDVTGDVTFTDGNWHFQNFNDKVVAFQKNKKPIVYAGLTFAEVADENAPRGGVGLAAFGRVWCVDDDGTSLRYSALLDETDWSSQDSGYLDLFNTWPGADQVVALAAFNASLIVFGERNILFFTDGQGSALGIDPLQVYVADTFSGTGCVARDSVQQVDGDLWFLSKSGLISIGRLVNERSNPTQNLSRNVQDMLRDAIQGVDTTKIESVYSPLFRFYLLSIPTPTGGQAFVFDTMGRLEDGSARCAGVWYSMVPRAMVRRTNEEILFALHDQPGVIGNYEGQQQPSGPYQLSWESGWIDLDAGGHLKFLKRFGATFFMDRTTAVTFKWAYDFTSSFSTQVVTFQDVGGISSEWGESEWGTSEWAGGINLKNSRVPGKGSGEYLKLGIDTHIDNTVFAIQNAELFAKIGRLA